MKYIVKFMSREKEKDIFTINPPMNIDRAQKISRDLQLMGMTAWIEKF